MPVLDLSKLRRCYEDLELIRSIRAVFMAR